MYTKRIKNIMNYHLFRNASNHIRLHLQVLISKFKISLKFNRIIYDLSEILQLRKFVYGSFSPYRRNS